MQIITLTSQARPVDVSAKDIIKKGNIPCVVYGNDMKNTMFTCTSKELTKTYIQAGESTIVELEIEEKKIPVLFHELQYAPVSGDIIHVDFYAIDMKKEIEAKVPVKFEGEAPCVKDLGGILITPHDHVTVKCLPTNLPHEIPINMETLTEFGSSLTVSELQVPNGVIVVDDPETVIATVQEPRKEEISKVVSLEESEEGEIKDEDSEGEEVKSDEDKGEQNKEDKKD